MCNLGGERSQDCGTDVNGNDTMLGQIATFRESLGFSYKEIFEEIPYENLIMMQKDKLHVVYGDKITTVSARSMIKSKTRGE